MPPSLHHILFSVLSGRSIHLCGEHPAPLVYRRSSGLASSFLFVVILFGFFPKSLLGGPKPDISDIIILKEKGSFLKADIIKQSEDKITAKEPHNEYPLAIPTQSVDYILYKAPQNRTIRLRGGLELTANYSHEDNLFIYFTNSDASQYLDDSPVVRKVSVQTIRGLRSGNSRVEEREKDIYKFAIAKGDILGKYRAALLGVWFSSGFYRHTDTVAATLDGAAIFRFGFGPRRPVSRVFSDSFDLAFSVEGSYTSFEETADKENSLTVITGGLYTYLYYPFSDAFRLGPGLGIGPSFLKGEKNGQVSSDTTFAADLLLNCEYFLFENMSVRFFGGYQHIWQAAPSSNKAGVHAGLGVSVYW